MICWKCKKDNKMDFVGRSTECEFCHADLHSCKGCKFYAPGNHFDCKENISEPVADKEKANFCDFFMINTDVSADTNADKASKAKDQFAALFGEQASKDINNSDNAKDAFNSLFGD